MTVSLEDFIILSALDQVYAEHSGLETYEALGEGKLLDQDSIWEPFEHYEVESISEYVENFIDAFKRFHEGAPKD
jgi:hypothetical protein